jgi:hypothetical protein
LKILKGSARIFEKHVTKLLAGNYCFFIFLQRSHYKGPSGPEQSAGLPFGLNFEWFPVKTETVGQTKKYVRVNVCFYTSLPSLSLFFLYSLSSSLSFSLSLSRSPSLSLIFFLSLSPSLSLSLRLSPSLALSFVFGKKLLTFFFWKVSFAFYSSSIYFAFHQTHKSIVIYQDGFFSLFHHNLLNLIKKGIS